MEKRYDTKRVYRVWIMDDTRNEEVFFTNKQSAIDYCNYINSTSEKPYDVAVMNKWSWEMKIEK